MGGIVWAGSIALSSAILADVYGVRLVGLLYGLAYLGHQVGGMISSWLGGWAFERYGALDRLRRGGRVAAAGGGIALLPRAAAGAAGG